MALVIALVPANVVVLSGAASADDSASCAPQVKNQVADVTERLRNWADVGTDDHVWALTDDQVRIQVWKLGTNHSCAQSAL